MRTTLRSLALLTPALMGAGAHCGPEPEPPCPSTYGEIGADSPWFDANEVRAVEWVLQGVWIYSSGYGLPENTGFTLELRWSGEPYYGYRFECADGTRTTGATSFPIEAHLRTDDGGFQEVFSATAEVVPGQIRYEFFDTPNDELVGAFQLPERATEGKECPSPYFEFLDLRLSSRRQVELVGLHSPGYAWMEWRCHPSAYPIGRPEIASVEPLEP